MNQIYKKENFIVVPIGSDYLVVNIDKTFRLGHTHVKKMSFAKLLIDLAIRKELPKNVHLVDSLVRISVDKNYIEKLEEFKENNLIDYKELMGASCYKRHKGAIRQVK